MVVEAIEPAGKNLVNVGLVADVEEDAVSGRVEDGVERERQFDNAEIGTEMAAGFRKRLDEECANFLSQVRHLRGVESLEVGRRLDRLKQCTHIYPFPGKSRAILAISPTGLPL